MSRSLAPSTSKKNGSSTSGSFSPNHYEVADWLARVIATGGTVSTARQKIVNQLALDIYSNGLRDSVGTNHVITYCVPFGVDSGSPVAAIFEPLWKPSGVAGTAVSLSSGSYSLTGYAFSGSNYYVTGYLPSVYMASSSAHMALDMRNVTQTDTIEIMGCGNATSYLDLYWYTGMLGGDGFDPNATTEGTSSITGLNLYNRNSSTSLRISNGGSLKASSSVSNTVSPPDVAVAIGTYYDTSGGGAPVPYGSSNETVGFLGLGLGMNTTQETAYNTVVSTFRTAFAAS